MRWSDADSDNHAPNEHLSIKEYMDGIAADSVCVAGRFLKFQKLTKRTEENPNKNS